MQQPYMFELRYGKWIKHDQYLHCGVEWCGVKIIYIFETTIYDFHRKILEILISLIFLITVCSGLKLWTFLRQTSEKMYLYLSISH